MFFSRRPPLPSNAPSVSLAQRTWTARGRSIRSPSCRPEEQIENTSLYFEETNKTWFLFTNHIGVDDRGEYTDSVWVYWSQDLNHWDRGTKPSCSTGELHVVERLHRPAFRD